jgi:hypothetical protein
LQESATGQFDFNTYDSMSKPNTSYSPSPNVRSLKLKERDERVMKILEENKSSGRLYQTSIDRVDEILTFIK